MAINNLFISDNAKNALMEIQKRLLANFDVEELVVFGNGVKKEAADGSEPDLLVITKEQVGLDQKQLMKDLVAGINDSFGTSFKLMIFDRDTWEVWSGQSVYQEVTRDGVAIW